MLIDATDTVQELSLEQINAEELLPWSADIVAALLSAQLCRPACH